MASSYLVPALSILSGGLAGAVVTFVLNRFHDQWRCKSLTKTLSFQVRPPHLVNQSVNVHNGGYYPILSCFAYITVEHELDDIRDLPDGTRQAMINTKSLYHLKEDRLCWSFMENPAEMDILAGENQSLQIYNWLPHLNLIMIPSEKAYQPPRICLTDTKSYKVTVKIVSKSTLAKTMTFTLDPRVLKQQAQTKA